MIKHRGKNINQRPSDSFIHHRYFKHKPAEAPNAGAEFPKAGDDEAPKTEVEPKGEED